VDQTLLHLTLHLLIRLLRFRGFGFRRRLLSPIYFGSFGLRDLLLLGGLWAPSLARGGGCRKASRGVEQRRCIVEGGNESHRDKSCDQYQPYHYLQIARQTSLTSKHTLCFRCKHSRPVRDNSRNQWTFVRGPRKGISFRAIHLRPGDTEGR
jgi:hypothetical protein